MALSKFMRSGLLLTIALFVSSSLPAQTQNPPQFYGQITFVGPDYYTLTPLTPPPGTPTSFTVHFGQNTIYTYDGGTSAPLILNDFVIGFGTPRSDGGWDASTITKVPPNTGGGGTPTEMPFSGTVTAAGTGYVDIMETGATASVRVTFTLPVQFVVGDIVAGTGVKQADGSIIASQITKTGGGTPPTGGGTDTIPIPPGEVPFNGRITATGTGYVDILDLGTNSSIRIFYTLTIQFAVNDIVAGSGVKQADGSIIASQISKTGGGGTNPPTGGPQPGEKFTIGGTISQLGNGFCVTTWQNQETNQSGVDTLKYDITTPIVDNSGNAIALAEGQNVQAEIEIQADFSRKVLRIIVNTGGEPGGGPQPGEIFQMGGQVTFVGSGFFIAQWSNPETGESGTDTVRYDPATTPIVDESGNPAQLTLNVGATAEIQVQTDGSLKVLKITVFSGGPKPGETFQMGGQVAFIGDGFFIAQWSNPETKESGTDTVHYDAASTPIVDENGNPAQLTVGVGATADIQIQTDGTPKVLKITVFTGGPKPGETFKSGGQVTFVGSGFFTVQWTNQETGESGTDTVRYEAASTPIVDENGNPAQLAVGVHVTADVEVQTDISLKALKITVMTGGPGGGPQPGEAFQLGGQITFVGSGFFVALWDNPETGESGTDTVRYDPASTPIVDDNGNPAQLAVGVVGIAEIQVQTDGTLKVLKITVHTGGGPKPGETFNIGGQVTFVGAGFFIAQWINPETGESGTDTVRYDPASTPIVDDSGNLTQLTVGVFGSAEIQVQTDGTLKVLKITVHTGGEPGGEPGGGPKPGETFQIGGQVTFIGSGFFIAQWINPETGESGVDTVHYDASTPIVDDSGNRVQLTVGGFGTAEIQVQTDGTLKVLKITVHTGGGGGISIIPQPGERFHFLGQLTAINGTSLTFTPSDTAAPLKQVTVVLTSGTQIFWPQGQILDLNLLAAGDELEAEGVVTVQDPFTMEASRLTYRRGTLRNMIGRVVELTTAGFTLETRDSTGQTVVRSILITAGTRIVRAGTGETAARADIIRDSQITVYGRIAANKEVTAIEVLVSQPERVEVGGKVIALGSGSFTLEFRDSEKNITLKGTITFSAKTVWLKIVNDQQTPAAQTDLAVGNFVTAMGVLTGALSMVADTVAIQSVEKLEVQKFTILDGKIDKSVFTFRINENEANPAQPASYTQGTFNVSPDFLSLNGLVVPQNAPADTSRVALSKISGSPGVMTGLWQGLSNEDGGISVSAELFQSGTSVTGTVTVGGEIQQGGTGGPQVGGQITLKGQVTETGAGSFVLSYRDNLNQLLQRAVLIHSGTKIVDVTGKILALPLDSLRLRTVDIAGVLQADYSVLANTITVTGGGGVTQPSADLPVIVSGSLNLTAGTLSLTLDGRKFDSGATGNVTLQSTELSSSVLKLTGSLPYTNGGVTINIIVKPVSGSFSGTSSAWNGSASAIFDGREKIWPILFSFVHEKAGQFSGNYQIGEGRFRTDIVQQNNPPVIAEFAPVAATEKQQITVQVQATDPDGDSIALAVSGTPISGSTFTDNRNGTGTYTLTVPTLPEGRTELLVSFMAQDKRGGTSSRVLKITVTKLNRPPELSALTDTVLVLEGKSYSISLPVRDPDGDNLKFTYTGLPAWAAGASNVVSLNPPAGSAGVYSFSLNVDDSKGGQASRSYSFRVLAPNRKPVFQPITALEVPAGQAVSFTIQATDPDPGDVLTYSVLQVAGVPALPVGATFNPASRTFSWSPSAQQSGPFKAAFIVTDSKGLWDKLEVGIFVGQASRPPVIQVVDSVKVTQGQTAQFTIDGSSPDNKKLTFYIRDLPHEAQFDPATRIFKWIPEYYQSGVFRVIAGVQDGSFRTEKDVYVKVDKAVLVPTLQPLQNFSVAEGGQLRFRVDGKYPDGKSVAFDTTSRLPVGSTFDVVTGSFRWIPSYSQAGAYTLTFSVTPAGSAKQSVSNTVTVTNVNRPPKLANLTNVAGKSGQAISFTVSATDPDSGDVLTYAAVDLPAGASFNTAVNPPAFSWTPAADTSLDVSFTVTDAAGASDRRPVHIAVGTQNLPPELGDIGDLTVSEGDTLEVTVAASDPEGDPVVVFVNPVPANAVFDDENLTFYFQPAYNQAGIYSLKFIASDGALSTEKAVTITVTDVALDPVISVPASWTVAEGEHLEITVNAKDATGQKLEVVSTTLPEGALMNSQTGVFTWTPDYDEAGDYRLSFIASDGSRQTQKDVQITVTDRNRPPVIFEIGDQEVKEGEVISFELAVNDPDGDEVTLAIDSSRTPYIQSVEIRNNSIFVFNTTLLDDSLQIPSAIFVITADDGRGGLDRRRIAFKIIREKDVDICGLASGVAFSYKFPGMGLILDVNRTGTDSVCGPLTGSEVSGELGGGPGALQLAAAGDLADKYPQLKRSKDKVKVRPFLSGDGTTGGDFYGVRRGWGLDLSAALLTGLNSLQFELTLNYEDRDIPATDIPEFKEEAITVFGLNLTGSFVQIPTTLDTVANTAKAQVDLTLYTDFTLGVILDLVQPVISNTTKLVNTADELGPYTISAVIVDNVIVQNAKLYWSLQGGSFTAVSMVPDTSQINGFTASIPGKKEGSTILYYVTASDESHTVTDPASAPGSAYRFSILLDGVQAINAGDSNNDGKIDIFDLLDMLQMLSGKKQASAGADADVNGKVDIFDLLALLKKLSGK